LLGLPVQRPATIETTLRLVRLTWQGFKLGYTKAPMN
jgi:hypothetical protein